jgi:uncharacterized protein (TIGR02646 family)
MTKARRGRVGAPLVLSSIRADGKTELERIRGFFRKPANRSRPFKWGVLYKHPDVKEALDTLFHAKCAYCETDFNVGGFGAVEHFRPKARVDEEDGSKTQPGYYWLAVAWNNLFLSCSRCNNVAKYRLPEGTVQLGKGNRFPISKPLKRRCVPGCESREMRLLIDPTIDNPASHLQFEDDGIVTGLTRKGRVSIEVFALRRPDLVQDRRDHATRIAAQIEVVRREKQACGQAKSNRPAPKKRLDEALDQLEAFLAPSMKYREMARQMLARASLLAGYDAVVRSAAA